MDPGAGELERKIARNILIWKDLKRLTKDGKVLGSVKRSRDATHWAWSKIRLVRSMSPVPETIPVLRRILRRHFGRRAEFVFLGPYTGEWRRAVEGALGKKIKALDATKSYLINPLDPYASLRIPSELKNDVWDVYPEGVGNLLLSGRNKVFVHFEFTPCIGRRAILCALLSLGRGSGYVHITSSPEDVRKALDQLKEEGLRYHYHEVPAVHVLPLRNWRPNAGVFILKARENQELVRAGRILDALLHTSLLPKQVGTEDAVKSWVRFIAAHATTNSKKILLEASKVLP